MNEALLESFRHHAWATRHLLAFCRDLPEEQLSTPTTGSYGGVQDTFNHLVRADAGYLRGLTGSGPDWLETDERADLDQLDEWVAETASRWEQFLSQPIDSERVIVVANGAYEARASVLVAQALHHGNIHREQICAILTGFGSQPPDIQAWSYSLATDRLWERAVTEGA